MFEDVAVGPDLATAVAASDPADLSDADLLDWMAAHERQVSHSRAQTLLGVAELARRRRKESIDLQGKATHEVDEFTSDEIALALRLTRVSAENRLGLAMQLDRMPATMSALDQGRIDPARAAIIAEGTYSLDDATLARVERAVAEAAETMTTGQTRAELGRALAKFAAEQIDARRAHAGARRRVLLTPRPDCGMGELSAMLPAADALSVWQALDALARGCGSADPRGMDARRADALVTLCTGRAPLESPEAACSQPARPVAPDREPAADVMPEATTTPDDSSAPRSGRRPVRLPALELTITGSTLLGGATDPARLASYGYVTADHALDIIEGVRRATGRDGASIRTRLASTDPATGQLLALSPAAWGFPYLVPRPPGWPTNPDRPPHADQPPDLDPDLDPDIEPNDPPALHPTPDDDWYGSVGVRSGWGDRDDPP